MANYFRVFQKPNLYVQDEYFGVRFQASTEFYGPQRLFDQQDYWTRLKFRINMPEEALTSGVFYEFDFYMEQASRGFGYTARKPQNLPDGTIYAGEAAAVVFVEVTSDANVTNNRYRTNAYTYLGERSNGTWSPFGGTPPTLYTQSVNNFTNETGISLPPDGSRLLPNLLNTVNDIVLERYVESGVAYVKMYYGRADGLGELPILTEGNTSAYTPLSGWFEGQSGSLGFTGIYFHANTYNSIDLAASISFDVFEVENGFGRLPSSAKNRPTRMSGLGEGEDFSQYTSTADFINKIRPRSQITPSTTSSLFTDIFGASQPYTSESFYQNKALFDIVHNLNSDNVLTAYSDVAGVYQFDYTKLPTEMIPFDGVLTEPYYRIVTQSARYAQWRWLQSASNTVGVYTPFGNQSIWQLLDGRGYPLRPLTTSLHVSSTWSGSYAGAPMLGLFTYTSSVSQSQWNASSGDLLYWESFPGTAVVVTQVSMSLLDINKSTWVIDGEFGATPAGTNYGVYPIRPLSGLQY